MRGRGEWQMREKYVIERKKREKEERRAERKEREEENHSLNQARTA